MGDHPNTRDRDYYRRRERQEREHAARTIDVTARRVHLEMADRYSMLLEDPVSASPAN
jgi:hypothetical protein